MAHKSPSKKERRKNQNLGVKEQQIRHAGMKILDWILGNLKIIAVIAGMIVIAIAISVGWIFYQKKINNKALALEAKTFKLHATAQSEAVSNSSDSAADDAAQAGNPYQEALELYQEIIEQYPGTESANRALYLTGSIEYELGNYEQAGEYFSTYIEKYPKGSLLIQAQENIGYIFEQQGKYQQALEQFRNLEAKIPQAKKAQILLAIGRNYETLENVDEAISTYQQIVDSSTSFSWKNKAKERLDILKAGKETPPAETAQEIPAEEQNSDTEKQITVEQEEGSDAKPNE